MARRGHGEGTITERSDGRWAAAVDLGIQDGKRARKWLYGKTRKEVSEKLTRTLRDLQQGIAPADETITLGDWITQYIDDLEARHAVAHATLVRYRGVLRNYIQPTIGHRRLGQLLPQHLLKYQADLLREGTSASTITVHRAVLSGAIGAAASLGMVPRNIVSLVKPPKGDSDPKGKALLPEHARALLAVTSDDPYAVFYLLLLTAGLRRGEALGLSWQDVTIENPGSPGQIHVRRQLQWPDGQATLVAPKSKRSVRRIPIPAPTTRALFERRACQQREFAQLGRRWRESDLVLTAPDGEPVGRNAITRQFQAYLGRAELPWYRLHDLRHTYGSLLMSQGVPLKTISELMGHGSIEVTADVYLHSLEGQVLDTANAVVRALGAGAAGGLHQAVCDACGRPF